MGLLDQVRAWWTKKSDVQIMADTLMAVLQAQAKEREAQRVLTQTMIDMHRDQMAVSQRVLEQYTAQGENQRSTLDQRLFRQEDEWEPVLDNPFEGLN